ncbi:MAG: PEP-CTERM sorting domain-containing protein [Planctomycetota bacterium]|nr:PEP-CTERM sorting domain-containing protein [Planctomycetota bacterium]
MLHRTCRVIGFVCAGVVLCAGEAAAEPFTIGVNFVGNEGYSPGGEAVLAPADLAGAIPQANWNNAYGGCHTLAGLRDADGDGTGVTVTWQADVYYLGVADLSADHRLMRGHLAPLGSDPITVTVTGLGAIALGPYDVLVYFDVYNSGQHDDDVAMTFAIGPWALTGTDPAGADFSGTFVEDTGAGGNYVRLGGLTGDGFVLEASGDGAAINALQIHHTPEPATLLLVAIGAAACAAVRRRLER